MGNDSDSESVISVGQIELQVIEKCLGFFLLLAHLFILSLKMEFVSAQNVSELNPYVFVFCQHVQQVYMHKHKRSPTW